MMNFLRLVLFLFVFVYGEPNDGTPKRIEISGYNDGGSGIELYCREGFYSLYSHGEEDARPMFFPGNDWAKRRFYKSADGFLYYADLFQAIDGKYFLVLEKTNLTQADGEKIELQNKEDVVGYCGYANLSMMCASENGNLVSYPSCVLRQCLRKNVFKSFGDNVFKSYMDICGAYKAFSGCCASQCKAALYECCGCRASHDLDLDRRRQRVLRQYAIFRHVLRHMQQIESRRDIESRNASIPLCAQMIEDEYTRKHNGLIAAWERSYDGWKYDFIHQMKTIAKSDVVDQLQITTQEARQRSDIGMKEERLRVAMQEETQRSSVAMEEIQACQLLSQKEKSQSQETGRRNCIAMEEIQVRDQLRVVIQEEGRRRDIAMEEMQADQLLQQEKFALANIAEMKKNETTQNVRVPQQPPINQNVTTPNVLKNDTGIKRNQFIREDGGFQWFKINIFRIMGVFVLIFGLCAISFATVKAAWI
jgi:hypothetical protein